MGLNLSAVIGQAGLTVAQAIKEENKRIDLLTEKALDYHTQEYYKKKDKRSDKLEEVESLIGELASKFGDDRAIERAAFYVNQNGVAGTRALMNTFDDERARNNDLNATDFFKYVPSGKDIPLKTKLEYAEGIVKPIQMSQPEFLGGVQRDRGIASLFTADPSTVLQQGYETRKGMGLYDTETTRPELEFGTGGADMSRIQGKIPTINDQYDRAEYELGAFDQQNPQAVTLPIEDPLRKQRDVLKLQLDSIQSRMSDRQNIKTAMEIPKTLEGAIFRGNYLMSVNPPGSELYKRGEQYLSLGDELHERRYGDDDDKNKTFGGAATHRLWNAEDKKFTDKMILQKKGGITIYNEENLGFKKGSKPTDEQKLARYNELRAKNFNRFVTTTLPQLKNTGIETLKTLASLDDTLKYPESVVETDEQPKPKDKKTGNETGQEKSAKLDVSKLMKGIQESIDKGIPKNVLVTNVMKEMTKKKINIDEAAVEVMVDRAIRQKEEKEQDRKIKEYVPTSAPGDVAVPEPSMVEKIKFDQQNRPATGSAQAIRRYIEERREATKGTKRRGIASRLNK